MAALMLALPWLARAERDSFFTGTGRDGAYAAPTASAVVNFYAQVTAAVAVGGTTIQVASTTNFAAGDLIMVHQTSGISPEPASGAAGPLDLTSSNVGRFELARISSISGLTVTLTKPLLTAFGATGAQIIRVPEYTDVTIASGRSIVASLWNGSAGGVVAFLASGTLTNNTTVQAVGRGFRAGQGVNDSTGLVGATGLDEPAPSGAQKGEGVAITRYGPAFTGRGRVANGGGGGVAYLSGGGGGSHMGAGGQGGNSNDGGRAVGGQGGAALSFTGLNRLFLGGAGGAGHSANGGVVSGATGGGCVFIRAGSLAGSGSLSASGTGVNNNTSGDGAGGGGAGGTIYLRVAGNATAGGIVATGGTGGTSTLGNAVGPGGGGGGGRIIFQKGSGTASLLPSSVNGGNAGVDQNSQSNGATAGSVGITTTLSGGFPSVAVPVLVTPAASGTVLPTSSFSGTATAGHVVHIEVDGVKIGSPTVDGSGNFSFTPSAPLALGAHSVEVYAENAAQEVFSVNSTARSFTVAAASTNALLSSLALSTGTLSPTFSPATTAYTATVLRPSASITVTPTVADGTATLQVRVNGGTYAAATSGSPSAALALNLGSNTIDVLVTAQDGTTTKTYTTTVTRWTYVEAWRNQYFSTIANTGSASDTATPRGDGLPNLLKFALGMNPTLNGVSPLAVTKNGSVLELTYPRSIEAMAECTFIVEWSDTLVSGSWSTTGVTENILSSTATLQQVKSSIPAGTGVDRRFARLRVTRP